MFHVKLSDKEIPIDGISTLVLTFLENEGVKFSIGSMDNTFSIVAKTIWACCKFSSHSDEFINMPFDKFLPLMTNKPGKYVKLYADMIEDALSVDEPTDQNDTDKKK